MDSLWKRRQDQNSSPINACHDSVFHNVAVPSLYSSLNIKQTRVSMLLARTQTVQVHVLRLTQWISLQQARVALEREVTAGLSVKLIDTKSQHSGNPRLPDRGG